MSDLNNTNAVTPTTTTTTSTGGYLYDGFIEEPDKTPQEQHFDSFKHFLSTYNSQLVNREIEMNDGDDAIFGKLWDSFNDCIKLRFEPYEVLRFDELIQTENHLLSKISLVFATLCDEIELLKKMVNIRLFFSICCTRIFGGKIFFVFKSFFAFSSRFCFKS